MRHAADQVVEGQVGVVQDDGAEAVGRGQLLALEGDAHHRERGEHARDMQNSAWRMFGEWYVNQKAQSSGGKDAAE